MEDGGGIFAYLQVMKSFKIQAGLFVLEIRLRHAHKYTNTL